MDTIFNISVNTNAGADFYLQLGDFLDSFCRTPDGEKIKMLADMPDDMSKSEYLPFLASTTHKLADDYGLQPPEWVFDERCYLPGARPHFACNASGNLRLWFMYKSPPEFKHRNLFVDENVLARV
ncbi:MAG: hypothetical protein LBI19_03145 [Oscillospiraceae bacterium]|jgi:hypothetical protein|nr:hypothetical protein [Oscillospiraceae bacterium]